MKRSDTNHFKIVLYNEIRKIITRSELESMGLIVRKHSLKAEKRARQRIHAVLKTSFSLMEKKREQTN